MGKDLPLLTVKIGGGKNGTAEFREGQDIVPLNRVSNVTVNQETGLLQPEGNDIFQVYFSLKATLWPSQYRVEVEKG